MAEQEITYIPYGLDEISLLDLMTSLANGVDSYLNSRNWGKKAKYRDAWLRAYQDIMTQGITGASNDTGIWRINHNGPNIDLSNKSNIEREMYGDAAYYILQQMSQMTPRIKKEEKKDESSKTKFDNAAFNSGLTTYIGSSLYGGISSDKWNERWANLDPEDRGIRGTAGRQAKMAELLASFRDKIKADLDKYSFEDTPYGSFYEWNNRVERALKALGNSEWNDDDKNALDALGINYDEWFNTGADKMVTVNMGDGTLKQMTQAEYNALEDKLNAEKATAKQKAALEKIALLKLTAYNNTLFLIPGTNSKMLGYNAQALKEKYGASDKLVLALYNYSLQDIRSLTPDLLSEIHGAYRYLANQPIDSNLLKQILQSNRYKGAAPNRFKKINGIDNLIWDSVAGHVIQVQTRLQREALKNAPLDLFAGVKTLLDIQNDYMNSTEGGFTPAELREVAALLFDLGAAVDPEGVTSATLSQLAAGIRDYNRGSDPEGWTWGDTGWATLDHGLGLLSAIPVVGGLVKGSWAAAKLGNYIPKMEKWIRLAGRAGSTYAMAANAPGALNTLNKIKNGEDLSLKDYLDLAYFFIGSLGHHQLNRGNRVERSAMKARGIETSNSVLNKAGITRTKAKTTNTSETTPILKVLKTGEDGKVETKEIPITKEQEAVLKKAKPGKLNEVATEAKINNIPEGYKIVEPTINSNWRSRVNTAKSWFGKGNSKIFGTPTTTTRNSSTLRSDEEFELYLSEHNNTWLKKIFNGSNRDIRRYDKYLGNNNQVSKSSDNKTTETKSNWSLEKINKYLKNLELMESSFLDRNKYNPSSKSLKKIDLSKDIALEKYSLADGKQLELSMSNGVLNIKGPEGINVSLRIHDQLEIKKVVSDIIKNYNNSIGRSSASIKRFSKEYIESLKELRRKGFLYKQGGTINNLDTIINDFLKNNNI